MKEQTGQEPGSVGIKMGSRIVWMEPEYGPRKERTRNEDSGIEGKKEGTASEREGNKKCILYRELYNFIIYLYMDGQ